MKLSVDSFRTWPRKSITLLGMSGVGKTRIATILRSHDWFHYSADYRLGTRYLDDAILDNIKKQAMYIPFLRDLLRSDSIFIRNNITVDHLKPVSAFLGKLGNPEHGGLSLREFKYRQRLHRSAEIAALHDMPEFIAKAHTIYGYHNFINDVGGSICELDAPEVLRVLDEHTLLLYIKATRQDEEALIRRATSEPKPLYYREAFLDSQLATYMTERGIEYIAQIIPDDFVRWIFPHLFSARLPRYDAIAREYGYTITTDELAQVRDTADFLNLIEQAITRRCEMKSS